MRFAALALVLACFAAACASAAGRGAAPAAASPAARQPLRFARLAWDSSEAWVAHALAADGFARAGVLDFSRVATGGDEPPEWAGRAFGRAARLAPEADAQGRLIAVTLRWAPDGRLSPMQRYADLVDAVRRRHGPWTVQVEPGRPVDEERFGRFAVSRRYGPRTAATLWTDAAGAAAVVQLDGNEVVWLRYESPRWESATREREDAAR